jgi:hypothetical protein
MKATAPLTARPVFWAFLATPVRRSRRQVARCEE